jgi:hypothetical protein
MRRFFNSGWWQRRGADACVLGSLLLFFIAFFPHALFGGWYPLAGDAFFYSYPLRMVAWRMLRAGTLPLWTPYLMSGYPLLSMAQIGLGYPLTWGYLCLPGYVAEQIYVLAPFLLAPAFTCLYLRELGRTPLAALLAGLTFGYGGMMASPLANNGLMPNAVMWLPLMLVAIERARRRPFVPCLLLATFAYAMSVLTGYGQGFLYIGLLAAAYALCLVLMTDDAAEGTSLSARLKSVRAWRPLLVTGGAGLLAIGVAAFQILETARVVRRSVRSSLSYEIFTQGSFRPFDLWRSLTTPLFYVIDMTTYVPPLAAALAIVAGVMYKRTKRTERDPRILFWLVVALIALLLMMGQFTPFYRIVYHLPLLNRFRVPSRHTFEWTFAVAVLAAYGWDIVGAWLGKRRAARTLAPAATRYAALALLALSATVGVLWYLKAMSLQPGSAHAARHITIYLLWKIAFVLLTLAALWRASLSAQRRWRYALLLTTLLVLCYVEPAILVARWWGGFSAARFAAVSPATRFLQQFPPEQNRIYTRVGLMTEQYGVPPRFDAANHAALYGLHDLAGYEPLILERYSRALGGVWLDSVHTLPSGYPDSSLLTARSHVLDILNNTYVVSYPNLETGIGLMPRPAAVETGGEVAPQATLTLNAPPVKAAALRLITSLSNSLAVTDGQVVARLRIYAEDGRVLERELQAGRDTAEWAHERADVRPFIKHKLAPVYDSTPVGGADGYAAHRYQTSLALDGSVRVRRVEITNVSEAARLGIYEATFVEAQTQRSIPLAVPYSNVWQPVYEQNTTLILHNLRACPRAWLVAEAEAVDGEEALRRIRGESPHEFDPRRTALLEVRPDELPPLPGGALAPESTAKVVSYQANHLAIETSAPTPTVLIVSELFYPGWAATVDGQPARISLADFLLRGVALPAGQHRVEMRYVAPAARIGALISVLTLGLLVGLAVFARRRRKELNRTYVVTPSETIN